MPEFFINLVPLVRIELTTSSLPWKRYTTKPQRQIHCKYKYSEFFEFCKSFLNISHFVVLQK